jgi:hypothetical protein
VIVRNQLTMMALIVGYVVIYTMTFLVSPLNDSIEVAAASITNNDLAVMLLRMILPMFIIAPIMGFLGSVMPQRQQTQYSY